MGGRGEGGKRPTTDRQSGSPQCHQAPAAQWASVGIYFHTVRDVQHCSLADTSFDLQRIFWPLSQPDKTGHMLQQGQ